MIVDRKRLMRALKLVGSVVEKRSTIPILSHVEIDGGRITGTDLDVELSMRVLGMGDSNLSIAMSAPDKVYAILKASQDDPATMQLEKGKLIIASGDVTASVFTLPKEDFPHIEAVGNDWSCEVGKDFMSALSRVRIAVSTEETRYYLNGIYLHHVADWTYRLVATDGHRLAYADVEMPGAPILNGEASAGVIIPRKALATMLGIHKQYREAPLRLRMGSPPAQGNEKRLPLDGGSTTKIAASIATDDGEITMTAKLIDGIFPNYQRVIPSYEAQHVAVMDVADMRRALGAIIGSQGEKTKAVKLNFVKRGLVLSATGYEDIGDVTIKVDAEGTGTDFEVGFNARYLMNVLTMTAGTKIRVEADDSSSPSRWYDPDSTNFRTVLMPMRV